MSHGDIWSWEGGVSAKKKKKNIKCQHSEAVPSWHVQGTVKSQVWLDWTDKSHTLWGKLGRVEFADTSWRP